MKIKLTSLEEGLNEITHIHSIESLNLEENADVVERFIRPINVTVSLNKMGRQYFLKVLVQTTGKMTCDRCLANFDQEVRDVFRIVYSSEPEQAFTSEDEKGLRYIASDTVELDITEDIKESVLLLIPMKSLCSETCQGICPECGINRNYEQCHHGAKPIDPRWEALKKIYNSNN